MSKDELVSVALIREDLRLLLVASSQYLDTERQGRSDPDWGERLALAIHRVGSTATAGQWQPKPEDPA
jgi:hypothetical protein